MCPWAPIIITNISHRGPPIPSSRNPKPQSILNTNGFSGGAWDDHQTAKDSVSHRGVHRTQLDVPESLRLHKSTASVRLLNGLLEGVPEGVNVADVLPEWPTELLTKLWTTDACLQWTQRFLMCWYCWIDSLTWCLTKAINPCRVRQTT